MSTPTLIDQATAILEAATSLQRQLEHHGLPPPSLDAGGRRDWHDASAHRDLLRTRSALIDASQTMLNLALGPLDALAAQIGPAVSRLNVLRALDSLGVADAVPRDGQPVGVDEVADTLGVEEKLLGRLLRFAYRVKVMGVFREAEEGMVAHTGFSAVLPECSAWLQLRLSKLFTMGGHELANAVRKRGDSDENAVKIPVQLADVPRHRNMWQILQEDDPDGKGMEKFSEGMKSMIRAVMGDSLSAYVSGFDWASLAPGTIIDVGGGSGHVEVGILERLPPDVHFIIQDLPANQESADELIQQHPIIKDRITFQPQDFFTPQPLTTTTPPKAYLLSRVLHDWQDEDCVRIIRPLVPIMETRGARLLVAERILPDGVGEIPNHIEQHIRSQDLLMYMLFGGGERSLRDWRALFCKADSRLRIARVRSPEGSVLSFIEVVLDMGQLMD